ncbi:MAG: 30S ribosomal protein S16, partial [Flavobacteriaceae bacterium]
MPVRIRLQRHGKKGKPFYWIVAADSRAKRDGRYLEKLGTYNPNTHPVTVTLDIDKSVQWLQNGAQPSDTARNLLSDEGVMLKNHLVNGVRKGALTEEQVAEKFEAWVKEKEGKKETLLNNLKQQQNKAKAAVLAAEQEVSAKRKAAAEETLAEETTEEAPVEAAAEEIPAAEETTEEAPLEAAAEEAAAEEAPAAEETAEETPVEAAAEEAAAEEAPAAEETAEETP